MGQYTTLERRDATALLTLNRPESYNAFDLPAALPQKAFSSRRPDR